MKVDSPRCEVCGVAEDRIISGKSFCRVHGHADLPPPAAAAPSLPPPSEMARVILGLPHGFTVDELKASYRAAVKRCHPDALGGSRAGEAEFRVVKLAHSILAPMASGVPSKSPMS